MSDEQSLVERMKVTAETFGDPSYVPVPMDVSVEFCEAIAAIEILTDGLDTSTGQFNSLAGTLKTALETVIAKDKALAEKDVEIERLKKGFNIVFDGPPAHESGRFVEVENDAGESISVGEWNERPDGLWELRL